MLVIYIIKNEMSFETFVKLQDVCYNYILEINTKYIRN